MNVGSGDVSATIDLFTIAQPTEPLRMALTYRTTPPRFGIPVQPLKGRWTHTFNQSITRVGAYRLQWYTATGERYFFDRSTPGHWYAAKPGTLRDRIALQGSEYVILHIDGSKSFFDSVTGQWLRKSDRWGNTITAEYTGGLLSAIVDALGRRIEFGYDGGGLSDITLPGGAKWRFDYDANGALDRVYDPLHTGTTAWRSITYWNGNINEIKDDGGGVLEGHSHDGNGRGRWSWRGNQSTDFYDVQYGSGDQRTVIRKLDGAANQTSTYTVTFLKGEYYPTRIQGGCPGCGGSASSDEQFTYYDDGQLETHTDASGYTTEYNYDPSGNVILRREAKATPKQRQFFYTYLHPTWLNFKTHEDVPSAFGRTDTTWTWNANETVLTEARKGKLSAEAAAPVTYTTTTTFDSRHRVLTVDGPRTDVSDVVTYTYHPDDDAEPNRRGRLHTVTNALGHVVTYDDYDVFGNAREITEPNDVVTTSVTDARGRVTSTTNHLVAGDPEETVNYTTSITYDSRDRIAKTTSARGFETQYVYQPGTNRVTEIIALNGNTPREQVERRRYTYTDSGEKETEEDQSCTTPAVVCTTWVTKRSVSFTYDGLNRLQEIVHPVPTNAKVVHGYDAEGRLQSIQDERHAAPNTFYDYDEHDRLERVRQVLPTAPGGYAITEYGYDQADNLTSVKDPNGNVTTYQYDDFGRMVKQASPVSGITTYTYDPAGNLLTTIDANGATTTRTYDALNRVRTSVSTKTGAPTETVEWTYDSGAYGIGRLRTMTDPTGSTTYQYDRRGIIEREDKVIRGVAYVTAFRHDADGNRIELTYPSGTKVTYTYDFVGRPQTATAGTTPLVTSAKYHPFGPMSEIVFGNGTTKTMLYDTRYRVDENKLTGPGNVVIAHYDYVSDAAGNITDIIDLRDGGYTRTFKYDDLNRLTTANTGAALWGTGSYTYDAMGNRETYALGSWRSGTLTYPSTTPQVGGIVYDAAGNETVEGPLTRKYSPRNQMAAIDDEREAAGVRHHIGYGYDGRGVRVWREQGYLGEPSPYAVRRYVYGPELQLLMTTHDSRPITFGKSYFSPLNIKAEYVWFGSLPLATLPPGGAPLTYFTDHLGTPLIQLDASGNVAWRAEYEPYGNIALTRVGKASDQPLRLPGQEYERTSNGAEENYNVFRWYRSGWGRYTQADPIGYAGGINWYAYADDNPIVNFDPTGLKTLGIGGMVKNASDCCVLISANAPGGGQQQVWLAPGESFGFSADADAIYFKDGSALKIPDWSIYIIYDCDDLGQVPDGFFSKPLLSYLKPPKYQTKKLPDSKSQQQEFGGPILPPKATCECK